MNEEEFSKRVLSRLNRYFFVYEQVWGSHFSGRKRIDSVLVPRDYSKWMNKNLKFGVEFKKPDSFMDATKVSSMIRQAYDYIYTDWDGFGHMPLLVCPLKVQDIYGGSESEMRFLRRVLGKFGIGEIRNCKYRGLEIIFQADHRIWSEKEGVSLGARWNFKFR